MARFNTCAFCGATLDPGEHCLCIEETEQKRQAQAQKWQSMTKEEKTGQIRLLADIYNTKERTKT